MHSTALNLASQVAGFSNFRHALKVLGEAIPISAITRFTMYASVPIPDAEPASPKMAVIEFVLSKALDDIAGEHQYGGHGLSAMTRRAADHVSQRKTRFHSREYERTLWCAACTLQFMAATGLRPGLPRKSRDKFDLMGMPGQDHASHWVHQETGEPVLVNEPYGVRGFDYPRKQDEWARKNGFTILRPKHSTMYAPEGDCLLELVTRSSNGVPLAEMVRSLDASGPVINANTSRYFEVPGRRFVSPAKLAETLRS